MEMEVWFETELLKKFFNTAKYVIEKRSLMPVLTHVAIGFSSDKQPKIQASSLSLTINHGSTSDFETGVSVPFEILYKAIKNYTGYCITFHSDGNCLTFGSSTVKIPTTPITEYPSLKNKFTGNYIFKRPIEDKDLFREKLKAVVPFVGYDDKRLGITGVHFDSENGKLVGTNGCCLVHVPFLQPDKLKDFTIPYKAGKALLNSDVDFDSYTAYSVGSDYRADYVVFSSSTHKIDISSDVLDADYPDYRQVIPKTDIRVKDISSKISKAVIEKVIPFCKKLEDKKLFAVMTVRNGAITIKATNPEKGEVSESIPCTYESDSELKVGMNVTDLKKFIGTLGKGEEYEFSYTMTIHGVSPLVFRGNVSQHETIISRMSEI